jgi:hypothetical protein
MSNRPVEFNVVQSDILSDFEDLYGLVLRGDDDLVVELVPDYLERLGLDLYCVYFGQAEQVYYLEAGVVALPVTAGDQLPTVTVYNALAFLYWELGEGFEFRQ